MLATVLLLLVIASVTWYYTRSTRNPVVVRFAVEMNTHSSAFWVALDKGWFEQEGVVLEYRVFSTGVELSAALTRGDVDVALACIGPLLVARDRGVPLKLIAMMHNHGYAVVVNPQSIKHVLDLDGKKIATSGPGTPTWLLLMLLKDKYGVKVEPIRMEPFTAMTALRTGQVEAAILPEHYATLAESMGLRVLARSQDIWQSMPGSGIAVTERFLNEHRELVTKIVKVLSRAVEFVKTHSSEAAQIIAKYLDSDPAIVEKSISNMHFDTRIDLGELQRYIDYLVKYGAIENTVKATEFADTSILEGIGLAE